VGRDNDLFAIAAALKSRNGRAAVTALRGLRGVGKTVLAVAYAERHSRDYRATWWIRAETEPTIRADLVGLGVRLAWVAADTPEEQAVRAILDRLRDEGDGILLIYDNAISPNELARFLPRGSQSRIIVTSNAPNWGGIATPVEIGVWPKDVGADFLVARTNRTKERDAALALSEVLGGLPLAHEQAAAYCERVGTTLAEYKKRFEATPVAVLDSAPDASREYHDGLTVARAFALAIAEAAKLHSAAEPLITYAALLAPEPIPTHLFLEGRETFSDPFASAIKDNGLDEAVAALRAFALVDRESVPDERDASIATDCIRLHRLVREVAVAQIESSTINEFRRELVEAITFVYPGTAYWDSASWPRVRRLDAIAMAIVRSEADIPTGSELTAATLLGKLEAYRDGVLAAYVEAKELAERALAIREKAQGADHPDAALSLNNLGSLLRTMGDLAGARSCLERALAICEKAFGEDHPGTSASVSNLAALLQ
jgi:tetratricopeptide (TPR) repeat protein